MGNIGRDGALQVLRTRQTIHLNLAVEQLVPAVHIGPDATVADIGRSLHAIEVIAAIAELLHIGLGLQTCTRRKEVGSASLQGDITRERTSIERRQEMLGIQAVGLQLCRIVHALGVQIHIGLDAAASFRCHEIGLIVLAIGLHLAFHADTFRNTHIA